MLDRDVDGVLPMNLLDIYLPPNRHWLLVLLAQAVLEEEKRVIMALRRGVETQDYVAVKSLLQQAEVMGLSGEEVKQAQAMRLRIEVRSVMSPLLSVNMVGHVARLGGTLLL